MIKMRIYFLIYFISSINCTLLIKEKKILDKFYYYDKYSNYINQSLEGVCSLSDGPDCFQIDTFTSKFNKPYFQYSNYSFEIGEISHPSNLSSLKDIYHSQIDNYMFYAQSPRQKSENLRSLEMNLLLSFSKYDEKVSQAQGTVYIDHQIDVSFEFEILVVTFHGKLQLAYSHDKKKSQEKDYPQKTYGIIESDDFEMEFNVPVQCDYFYIRNHFSYRPINQIVIETSLENTITQHSIQIIDNVNWVKVTKIANINFTGLKIPKGFEIDNLSFKFQSFNHYNYGLYYYRNLLRPEMKSTGEYM